MPIVLEMFAHHLPLSASWLPFTEMLAGEDAKLTVMFPRHGMKKLMERFANLKKA